MGTEEVAVVEKEGAPAEKIVSVPNDEENKIIRQIEYYFGNFNLSKDKFLKEEIKNNDGWVPLETLVKFNRLKQITVDFNAICEALKKAPNQLLEINEDSTKIRRKAPLSDSIDRDEIDERTLYVKGFNRDTSLDEILEYFKEHKVENIFMRRNKRVKKPYFKGSVFATFDTLEACNEFLNKTGLKYKHTELLKEKKKDYIKRKDLFFDQLRAEKSKKGESGGTENAEVASLPFSITKGCLLALKGLGEGISREDIKEVCEEKIGKVAFVDYHRDNDDAIVRFETPIKKGEEEEEMIIEVKSKKPAISIIEGDEEEKYYKHVAQKKTQFKGRHGQGKRGMHHGNRGRFNKKQRGRRFQDRNDNNEVTGKKRKFDTNDGETNKSNNSDEPSVKQIKTDSTD